MADIPTTEPTEIQAGDTVKWNRTDLVDYPSPTWTLKYYLVKSGTQIVIIAAQSGTAFSVVLSKTITAAYAAGIYRWVAKVSMGTEEYTVDSGTVEVLPDLVASTTGLETRSDARKIYDDLISAYKAYISANGTMHSFSIGGKTVQYKTAKELLDQIKYWATEVQREQDSEAIANGKPTRNVIKALL